MSCNHKDCSHEEHEERCSMQGYRVSQLTVEVFPWIINLRKGRSSFKKAAAACLTKGVNLHFTLACDKGLNKIFL